MAIYHFSAKLFQRTLGPRAVAAANRAAAHLAIARRAGARLLDAPDLALAALTHERSTFTRQDLALFINTHTADGAQFDAVMARVEAAGAFVRAGRDGCGRDRFTTKTIAAVHSSETAGQSARRHSSPRAASFPLYGSADSRVALKGLCWRDS
jgi:hypothetical protein